MVQFRLNTIIMCYYLTTHPCILTTTNGTIKSLNIIICYNHHVNEPKIIFCIHSLSCTYFKIFYSINSLPSYVIKIIVFKHESCKTKQTIFMLQSLMFVRFDSFVLGV